MKAEARGLAVDGRRLIKAPLQRVWHLLSRLESHPRYITLWLTADVRERSPTAAVVEFRGFFGGLPIASTQKVTLNPPARIEFRQIRGELRELSGAYLLADVDGDTDVGMQLTIDAGIPLFPDASVQQIAVSHIEGTLSRIKASAERDLVRLTPRRVRPAGTAWPGGASAPDALNAGAPASSSDAEDLDDVLPAADPGVGSPPRVTPERGGGAPGFPVTPGSTITAETGTAAPSPQGAGRRGRRRRRRRGRGRDGARSPAPGAGESAVP